MRKAVSAAVFVVFLAMFVALFAVLASSGWEPVQYFHDRAKYTVLSDNDDPAVAVDWKGQLEQVQFGALKVVVDRFGNQPHFYVFTGSPYTQVGQYAAIANGDILLNTKPDNPYYAGVIGPEAPEKYLSEENHFINAATYTAHYHLLKPGTGEISEFTSGFGGKYTQPIHQWICQHFGGRTACGTRTYAFTDISKIISLYGKTLTGRYDKKTNMVILSISSQ